jgi:hypothetical protein
VDLRRLQGRLGARGDEPDLAAAQRADGKWFVAVVAVNDETHKLDEGLVVNAAQGTLAILGNEAP